MMKSKGYHIGGTNWLRLISSIYVRGGSGEHLFFYKPVTFFNPHLFLAKVTRQLGAIQMLAA
jgi:hypothetical protein